MQEKTISSQATLLATLQSKVFPPVAIVSVATFGWAIRGQAGFGSIPGCVFAGTLIALTWYYYSTRGSGGETRPYTSGWSVLTIALGIGIQGMHGWSQFGTWVEGEFWISSNPDVFLEISPVVGFTWWFVAAVPWGATGAVFLAWTRRGNNTSPRLWLIRLAFGGIGLLVAGLLFATLPSVFLPYWGVAPYNDFEGCHGCMDTYNHILQAMLFMGLFLGFLAFEIWRKNWRNVKLISIVGLVTGVGWMVGQAWMFADEWFPGISWNWWRCWEASAGFSIGIGYAIAFLVCNKEQAASIPRPHDTYKIAERYLGLFMGIVIGLVYAITGGIKGMFAIYDDDINALPYIIIAGIMLAGGCLVPLFSELGTQIKTRQSPSRPVDHAVLGRLYPVILSALFIVGISVTGPISSESERAFIVFYLVLWSITISGVVASTAADSTRMIKINT